MADAASPKLFFTWIRNRVLRQGAKPKRISLLYDLSGNCAPVARDINNGSHVRAIFQSGRRAIDFAYTAARGIDNCRRWMCGILSNAIAFWAIGKTKKMILFTI